MRPVLLLSRSEARTQLTSPPGERLSLPVKSDRLSAPSCEADRSERPGSSAGNGTCGCVSPRVSIAADSPTSSNSSLAMALVLPHFDGLTYRSVDTYLVGNAPRNARPRMRTSTKAWRVTSPAYRSCRVTPLLAPCAGRMWGGLPARGPNGRCDFRGRQPCGLCSGSQRSVDIRGHKPSLHKPAGRPEQASVSFAFGEVADPLRQSLRLSRGEHLRPRYRPRRSGCQELPEGDGVDGLRAWR
ncbi:hypothetical protein RCH12_003391 [Cryobacterium sp. MP_3.1]|nr:hypothetical protein [Cryobacterium sp. MP_3.1]